MTVAPDQLSAPAPACQLSLSTHEGLRQPDRSSPSGPAKRRCPGQPTAPISRRGPQGIDASPGVLCPSSRAEIVSTAGADGSNNRRTGCTVTCQPHLTKTLLTFRASRLTSSRDCPDDSYIRATSS